MMNFLVFDQEELKCQHESVCMYECMGTETFMEEINVKHISANTFWLVNEMS